MEIGFNGAPRGAGGTGYVFQRTGTTWAQQSRLTSKANGGLGAPLKISGNAALFLSKPPSISVRNGITWNTTQIPSPGAGTFINPRAPDTFGTGIDLDGTTIGITQPNTSNPFVVGLPGRALIYTFTVTP
jgi:hypothetical protein